MLQSGYNIVTFLLSFLGKKNGTNVPLINNICIVNLISLSVTFIFSFIAKEFLFWFASS